MIYYICIYLHIFIHKSMKPSELQDPAGYRLEDQKSDRPQQSHCGTLHWKCHEMSMNHGSMFNSQFKAFQFFWGPLIKDSFILKRTCTLNSRQFQP